MSESAKQLETLIARGYQHGFVTDIDADTVPPGLDEDVVRLISRKKEEPAFLTEWRLKALRHWLTMKEPHWAHVKVAPIDYQAISYYSAPKAKKDGPKSLEEVDPKLLETYAKLGGCSVRQCVRRHDLQGAPGRSRRGVPAVLGSRAPAPCSHRAVPGERRTLHG
jgi:hypothetical protein